MDSNYRFVTNLSTIYILQMELALKNNNITDYIIDEAYDCDDPDTVGLYSSEESRQYMMRVFSDFARLTQMQEEYMLEHGITKEELQGKRIYVGCEYDYFPERFS